MNYGARANTPEEREVITWYTWFHLNITESSWIHGLTCIMYHM